MSVQPPVAGSAQVETDLTTPRTNALLWAGYVCGVLTLLFFMLLALPRVRLPTTL